MTKAKVEAIKAKTGTEAFHLSNQDGKRHIVAVKALHVLLVQDGDGWFAQGLEIDYAATGSTIDETKNNFAEGLSLTAHEHLTIFGDIHKLLVPAPAEAWKEYLAASPASLRQGFSTIQIHELDESKGATIPFEEIQFVTPVSAAAIQHESTGQGQTVSA